MPQLWSLRTDDDDIGPPLPARIDLSLLIAGLGAIGSAVTYLLKRLPARGLLWLLDNQRYELPNLGTCMALEGSGISELKARYAADYLGGAFETRVLAQTISDARVMYDGDPRRPMVAFGCFDNIDARHELQDLWPDLIVDAALSQTFACQISRWQWTAGGACLRCQFLKPAADGLAIAEEATGLSRERLLTPDAVITIQDIESAPQAKRDALRASLGKLACSVASEATIRALQERGSARSVAPSVPFVALLAATMQVAQLVRETMAPVLLKSGSRFQFDALWGPQGGLWIDDIQREDCLCHAARSALSRHRAARTAPIAAGER